MGLHIMISRGGHAFFFSARFSLFRCIKVFCTIAQLRFFATLYRVHMYNVYMQDKAYEAYEAWTMNIVAKTQRNIYILQSQ